MTDLTKKDCIEWAKNTCDANALCNAFIDFSYVQKVFSRAVHIQDIAKPHKCEQVLYPIYNYSIHGSAEPECHGHTY